MAERSVIREMLEEELDRNPRAQRSYEAERDRLPKSSVTVKQREGGEYC